MTDFLSKFMQLVTYRDFIMGDLRLSQQCPCRF